MKRRHLQNIHHPKTTTDHTTATKISLKPFPRIELVPVPSSKEQQQGKETVKNLLLAGSLLTLASALVGGLHISYRSWQQRELERIQTHGFIAETELGPVEYQTVGHGPAVIYAHGTPGGYDQGISFTRFLGGEDNIGCTFISPSRPGYLRTPLSSGATPEAQADLYAALLDALGIEKTSILGFSGGGPSALQFAIRHPNRCSSLVMMGGIVQRNDAHERMQTLPIWKRIGLKIVEALLVSDPFLYLAVPIARRIPSGNAVAGMLCSGAHYALRRTGFDNDQAQFASINSYPLAQISVPTLIVHGKQDGDVPFTDAELLAHEVPNAKLMGLDGDHSAFYTYGKTVMPMVHTYLTM
jgi:pimeloyl-ACP methyl ester carboxylesterase